jgi:hypothetical protein
MAECVPARIRWAIGAGLAVVLAGPAALLWRALTPEAWDPQHLRVRFESVRYERAGLVFTYRLENRTGRSAHLQPNLTTITLMQAADHAAAGVPVINLPLDIDAYSTRPIEVRLELPLPRSAAEERRKSEEQTRRVLQHRLPGPHDLESPLAELPMSRGPAPPQIADVVRDLESLFTESLSIVDGFELNNSANGIRIVFPRGW